MKNDDVFLSLVAGKTTWRRWFGSRIILPLVFLTLTMALAAGCATVPKTMLPSLPADPDKTVPEGRLVWIDLVTENILAAESFYSRLFGWRFSPSASNPDYHLIDLNGKPIAGMVAAENQKDGTPESLWLVSLYVKNVDQKTAAARASGGQVLEGPLDAGDRGRMALISDAAGAPIILLDAPGAGPAGASAQTGMWMWADLVTVDHIRAETFYGKLMGYDTQSLVTDEGGKYTILKRSGRPQAGIVELQWQGLEDNWLPYFKVADIDQSIALARKLGGGLILRTKDAAVLADPTGAAFGIQMP